MINLEPKTCQSGNEIEKYCYNPICRDFPVACLEDDCICKKRHQYCEQVSMKDITQKLIKKKELGSEYVNSLVEFIDQNIKWFTIMKQRVQQLDDDIGWTLEQSEKIVMCYLLNKEIGEMMTSKTILNVVKSNKEKSEIQNCFNQKIKTLQKSVENLENDFQNVLSFMKNPSIIETKQSRKSSYDYNYYEPTDYSFRKYSQQTNHSERKPKLSKHGDFECHDIEENLLKNMKVSSKYIRNYNNPEKGQHIPRNKKKSGHYQNY